MESIFIESSETLGLLYNRYHKIPSITGKFMNVIEKQIKDARKNGAPSSDSLLDDLDKFKKNVEINVKNPEPIRADEIKSQRKNAKQSRMTRSSFSINLLMLKKKRNLEIISLMEFYLSQRFSIIQIMKTITFLPVSSSETVLVAWTGLRRQY